MDKSARDKKNVKKENVSLTSLSQSSKLSSLGSNDISSASTNDDGMDIAGDEAIAHGQLRTLRGINSNGDLVDLMADKDQPYKLESEVKKKKRPDKKTKYSKPGVTDKAADKDDGKEVDEVVGKEVDKSVDGMVDEVVEEIPAGTVEAIDDKNKEPEGPSNQTVVLWSIYGFLIALIILGIMYVILFTETGSNFANNPQDQQYADSLSVPEKQKKSTPVRKTSQTGSVGGVSTEVTKEDLPTGNDDVASGQKEKSAADNVIEESTKDIDITKTFDSEEVLDGMKLYSSDELGFEFAIPSGWSFCTNPIYVSDSISLAFFDADKCPDDSSGVPPQMAVSLSNVPANEILTAGDVYEFRAHYNDTDFDLYEVVKQGGNENEKDRVMQTVVKEKYLTILFPSTTDPQVFEDAISTFKLK